MESHWKLLSFRLDWQQVDDSCPFTFSWYVPAMTSGYEPSHEKTNKMSFVPSEDSDHLGIRPVWSESLLSAWRNVGSLATHWAHSEDSDQSGRMLILSWGSSYCYSVLILIIDLAKNLYKRHILWVVVSNEINTIHINDVKERLMAQDICSTALEK